MPEPRSTDDDAWWFRLSPSSRAKVNALARGLDRPREWVVAALVDAALEGREISDLGVSPAGGPDA